MAEKVSKEVENHEKKLEQRELTSSELLKRYLYCCDDYNLYVTGCKKPFSFLPNLKEDFLEKILKSENPDLFTNIIEIADGENLLSRRSVIFYLLAKALTAPLELSTDLKNKLYNTALHCMKNDEEFFLFIRFMRGSGKNFPTGLQKMVKRYYMQKTNQEFAKAVVLQKSVYGWRHSDVLKLTHWKPDSNVQKLIITYSLFGMSKIEDAKVETDEEKDILQFFSAANQFMTSNDDIFISKNVIKYCDSARLIPSVVITSQLVWETLIPSLSIQEIITLLPRLHKYSFLKQDSLIQKTIVELLKDKKKIQLSGIHPVEIFIALRNFEKGGKPKDIKLIKYLETKEETKKEADPDYIKKSIQATEPIKNSFISGALMKALNYSFENLQPTGKSILISIDPGNEMDKNCLTTKNLTCYEAAAILTLCFFKVEKRLSVHYFHKKGVSYLQIEKDCNLNNLLKKLQELPEAEAVFPWAPIEWALHKKKQVDLFINMCQHSIHKNFPRDSYRKNVMVFLKDYNDALNMNAKFINCTFGVNNHVLCGGHLDGLNINGFDKEVPKVIEAFVKNHFQ